jgi:hypothetical protein
MNQLPLFETNQSEEEMRYTTFVEERNDKNTPTKLSLWMNVDRKLFIEMQPDSNESDYADYQCISLGLSDAKALLEELSNIIKQLES